VAGLDVRLSLGIICKNSLFLKKVKEKTCNMKKKYYICNVKTFEGVSAGMDGAQE